MPNLSENLVLSRCPHCAVASPLLKRENHFDTNNHEHSCPRKWAIYVCGTCGGVVSACAGNHNQPVKAYYPTATEVDIEIPDRQNILII